MGTPSHSARLENIHPMGMQPLSSRHLSIVRELKKYVSTYTRTRRGAPGWVVKTLRLCDLVSGLSSDDFCFLLLFG